MTVLETERLLLRHLRMEDLDDLAALSTDPDFTRFFGGPRPLEQARERARVYLERVIVEYDTIGYGFYATIYKPEERFIGRCGLLTQIIDGITYVEVAYGIAPAYWGRGLATEAATAIKEYAFRRFGFPRLISIVDPENIASRRVAEKNGMRVEKMIQFKGFDCCLYSVARGAADQA
jgi:[ribosomal protein S5]-alanine N-acetyltransferase